MNTPGTIDLALEFLIRDWDSSRDDFGERWPALAEVERVLDVDPSKVTSRLVALVSEFSHERRELCFENLEFGMNQGSAFDLMRHLLLVQPELAASFFAVAGAREWCGQLTAAELVVLAREIIRRYRDPEVPVGSHLDLLSEIHERLFAGNAAQRWAVVAKLANSNSRSGHDDELVRDLVYDSPSPDWAVIGPATVNRGHGFSSQTETEVSYDFFPRWRFSVDDPRRQRAIEEVDGLDQTVRSWIERSEDPRGWLSVIGSLLPGCGTWSCCTAGFFELELFQKGYQLRFDPVRFPTH